MGRRNCGKFGVVGNVVTREGSKLAGSGYVVSGPVAFL